MENTLDFQRFAPFTGDTQAICIIQERQEILLGSEITKMLLLLRAGMSTTSDSILKE